MSGQTLVDVLAEHAEVNVDHAMHGFRCSCGWGKRSGPPPWRKWSSEEFDAHLADAVTSWIDERLVGARGDVAKAFDDRDECEHERDVDAWGWECQPCSAEAALNAVREALGIEVRA